MNTVIICSKSKFLLECDFSVAESMKSNLDNSNHIFFQFKTIQYHKQQ